MRALLHRDNTCHPRDFQQDQCKITTGQRHPEIRVPDNWDMQDGGDGSKDFLPSGTEVGPAEFHRQGLSRCGDGGRAMRIGEGRDGGANKEQTKEVFRGSHN